MEIKNVLDENDVKYPKLKEVKKSKIKKSIPAKWRKLGITSFVMGFMMKSKVWATTTLNVIAPELEISGAQPYHPAYYDYVRFTCSAITLISIITFIISLINIIHTKIKGKKENKEIKINKKIKILLIVSIILIIASRIVMFLLKQYN